MDMTAVEYGNTVAIVLDRSLADQLDITPGTQLNGSTDGQALIITPVPDEERQARFRAALDRVNTRYAHALKRLAE